MVDRETCVNFFRVVNFERFQHYKDRIPPWIKLYNEVLDDYEFVQLEDAERWHLMGIWLLASRMNNRIPRDPAWVAQRISSTEPVDLDRLEQLGFIAECSESTTEAQVTWSSRYVSDELRSKVLRRDEHRCTSCKSTENLEIDHVLPISQGGSSECDNLQVLCRSCNRKKRTTHKRYADAEHVATQEQRYA